MDGESWATTICELNFQGKNVVLKALIEPPASAEWRAEVLALAQAQSFPNTYKATQAGEFYYSFYAVKGPENKADNITSEHVDDFSTKIWTWAKSEIRLERFTKMTQAMLPLIAELPVSQLAKRAK